MKIILLFGAICLGGVLSQSPVGFLHDRVDFEYVGGIPFPRCVGETVAIEQEMPDLSLLGWEDRAVGVGDAVGPFLFYADPNYNGSYWVFYIVYPLPNSCSAFVDGEEWSPIGSLRAVGPSEDWQRDSITVYEGWFFQDEEALYTTSQPSVPLHVKSLILTGASPWTLYTEENYTGQSVCVLSEYYTYPTAHFDTLNLNPPMEHGTIRSIARGCNFKKTSPAVTKLYYKKS